MLGINNIMNNFNIPTFLEEYQRYSYLWLKIDSDYKLRNKRDSSEKKLLEVTGLNTVK